MAAIDLMNVVQALTAATLLIGVIGGVVQVILHSIQIRRERLEIRELERKEDQVRDRLLTRDRQNDMM